MKNRIEDRDRKDVRSQGSSDSSMQSNRDTENRDFGQSDKMKGNLNRDQQSDVGRTSGSSSYQGGSSERSSDLESDELGSSHGKKSDVERGSLKNNDREGSKF